MTYVDKNVNNQDEWILVTDKGTRAYTRPYVIFRRGRRTPMKQIRIPPGCEEKLKQFFRTHRKLVALVNPKRRAIMLKPPESEEEARYAKKVLYNEAEGGSFYITLTHAIDMVQLENKQQLDYEIKDNAIIFYPHE